jgi:hypothetical protein
MAYTKITATDLPKRSRQSVSRFEKTEDWRLMRADIEKGLKANEALQVVMTDEDKLKYKIKNRRTVARFVRKYLNERKLPYVVKSFHRDDMGDVLIVQSAPRRR